MAGIAVLMVQAAALMAATIATRVRALSALTVATSVKLRLTTITTNTVGMFRTHTAHPQVTVQLRTPTNTVGTFRTRMALNGTNHSTMGKLPARMALTKTIHSTMGKFTTHMPLTKTICRSTMGTVKTLTALPRVSLSTTGMVTVKAKVLP